MLAIARLVLRALCETIAEKRPALLEMIRRIIDNLVLPLAGSMAKTYPLDPQAREQAARYHRHPLRKRVDGWILSTDVGCIFILLDGLVQAWSILQDDQLRPLIRGDDRGFSPFRPRRAIRAQHPRQRSPLCAVCCAMPRQPAIRSLVDAVAERFDLYKRLAIERKL
jgi:hypothetical protein